MIASALASRAFTARCGPPLLVAVHGVLSGITQPSWTSDLAHWLWRKASGFRIIERHYAAGPFPLLNCFFLNPFLSRWLAAELKPFAEDGASISFVSHSNGADIVVRTIRRLARLGVKVDTAVFIGAAISCDVRRSGIEALLESGSLGRVIAYCAADDFVLSSKLTWPNGHLGRLGFRKAGKAYPPDAQLATRVMTRWSTGGHSNYFTPERIGDTFTRLAEDLNPIPF